MCSGCFVSCAQWICSGRYIENSNMSVALQNIQYTCPVFSTILINTYRFPAPLYVDGDVIYSNEGTTQGDALAICLFTPCLQYLLFVDYRTMSLRHGMQMMQVLVVKFHICVCGGTSFHTFWLLS